jgi:hypothetical protein
MDAVSRRKKSKLPGQDVIFELRKGVSFVLYAVFEMTHPENFSKGPMAVRLKLENARVIVGFDKVNTHIRLLRFFNVKR